MPVSVFDLFSVGIGPSSSHTVGPMRAAKLFTNQMVEFKKIKDAERILVDLYGSLALTGKGHGIDKAIILGLEGEMPESVDLNMIEENLGKVRKKNSLFLAGVKAIEFVESRDLIYHRDVFLEEHSNAMCMTAYNLEGEVLHTKHYYSVGGGFVVDEASIKKTEGDVEKVPYGLPYPYETAKELLQYCGKEKLDIIDVVWANELVWRSKEDISKGLIEIWEVMKACILRGCQKEGVLPGGLGVKRRAPELYQKLAKDGLSLKEDPSQIMDWISLYALAVNEENAAGGRVVTAPTNGAAGVIPAVLQYQQSFMKEANDEDIVKFLLVAGAVGFLYKKGASLSAAEVGCQGEVGVACSMAAAGLAAVMGGTSSQIENAAEIGMEHNLGLTCDPVGGLVQIPCIERNTMGAVKAVNAARLALKGDGMHKVSLDKVIATMKQTGKDMQVIYKETSQGGLAVNLVEC